MRPSIATQSDTVTTIELAAIKRDRRKLEALRAQCDALAESLREREDDVIERIEAGARTDRPAVVLTRSRQNIRWLSIARHELGEEAIARVRAEWPVTLYKHLQLP